MMVDLEAEILAKQNMKRMLKKYGQFRKFKPSKHNFGEPKYTMITNITYLLQKILFLLYSQHEGAWYLLNAASLSTRTVPRNLWTAIQSLSFHSLTGPSALFLL